MRDEIFKEPGAGRQRFEFNAQVAAVFDDMASRSVPFYHEVLAMSAELARDFYQQGTQIYDLGCSTGSLLKALLTEFGNTPFRYTGIDSSPAMIEKAHEKFSGQLSEQHRFVCADITEFAYEPASVVVANYTLQFLKPLARQPLLRKIFSALSNHGCLIVSEKCLEDSADISRLYTEHYHALKLRNGYSMLEIAAKRDALENVLIPFRVSENTEMLEAAGFSPVSVFFKYYNFVSFLALKA